MFVLTYNIFCALGVLSIAALLVHVIFCFDAHLVCKYLRRIDLARYSLVMSYLLG